jgi:hypothetical protein
MAKLRVPESSRNYNNLNRDASPPSFYEADVEKFKNKFRQSIE